MFYRQWLLREKASPPSGNDHGTNRGARPRPASAGLLYFKAHLKHDGETVVPPQGRGARHVAGRNSDSYPLLSSRRERNALREPSTRESTNAGGTTAHTVDAAGGRPGLLSDSAAVATAAGERGWEEQGGEVGYDSCRARNMTRDSAAMFSTTAAVAEEDGYTFGPTIPATTTNAAIDKDERNPWNVLLAAPPPDLLRSPRVECEIPVTTGCADLGVQGIGRVLIGGPRRPTSGRRTLQLPVAVAAATKDEDAPSPCRESGRPPSACEVETTTAVRVSTLEMISAMTNVSPSVPPECVTGLEIRIRAKQTRPASASPRHLRTAAGITNRVTVGCGHYNLEVPSRVAGQYQPSYARATGATFRGVATPCNPLLRVFSWTGGEGEVAAASSGNDNNNDSLRKVAASQLFSENKRGGDGGLGAGGVERPRTSCCADDLQLYVEDSLEKNPGSCTERFGVHTHTDARLDRLSPGNGGEGGEGEGGFAANCGEEQPFMSTPFSR